MIKHDTFMTFLKIVCKPPAAEMRACGVPNGRMVNERVEKVGNAVLLEPPTIIRVSDHLRWFRPGNADPEGTH